MVSASRRPLRVATALVLAAGMVTATGSPAAASYEDDGQWSSLIDWPIIPIHMAMTPDGNVMSYGSFPNGDQGGDMHFDVWIPALGTGAASHSLLPNNIHADFFCSVQVIDPITDSILTVGGDVPNGAPAPGGVDDVARYSTSGGLQPVAAMGTPRYYPSANTLPDGRILVEGGSTGGVDGPGVTTPEIYETGVGWTSLTGINSDYAYGDTNSRWWYPRSWVAPDGRVFGIAAGNMYYLDTAGTGSITPAGTFDTWNKGASSTAVMYRPGKILQVGGGAFDSGDYDRWGSVLASVVDINSGSPVVTQVASMTHERHWANSTVMPDGKVLVTGGSLVQNEEQWSPALTPELWDPDTNTWEILSPDDIPRLYHSAAMLLPDATVLVGGGGAPGPAHLDGQIFSPPYLFDGNSLAARPSITSAPTQISYGQNFSVSVSADVTKATLIRTSAVTHSFNSGQRYMELNLSGSGTNRTITAPANGNLAPPGTYMLFVLNAAGTPSIAAMIDIDPGVPVPPDTEVPTVDVVTPAIGSTETGADITVTGTSSDNTGVTQVRGYLKNSTTGDYWNGTAWVTSWAWFIVPTDANGGWTYTAPGADDGNYSAIAWSWDAAGNRSTPDTNTFSLGAEDTELPVVDVVTPTAGSTETGPDLTVNGTSGDNVDVVQVRGYLKNSTTGDYWNGTAWVTSWAWFIVPTDANGGWTYTAPGADDGNYSAIAWSWDAAGNRSTPDTNTFSLGAEDTEDPVVHVVTPAAGSTETGPDLTVNGTSGDNVDVVQVRGYLKNSTTGDYWNGTAWVTSWAWFIVPTDANGGWTYTAPGADDGNYSAIAWSWDAAGNRSTPDTNTFSLGAEDTEDPVVHVVTPAAGSTETGADITVTGTSSDNTGVTQVRGYLRNTTTGDYWNGTAWVTSWAWFVVPTNPVGDWTFTASNTDDGNYQAIAWSWDAAGNRSPYDFSNFTKSTAL